MAAIPITTFLLLLTLAIEELFIRRLSIGLMVGFIVGIVELIEISKITGI